RDRRAQGLRRHQSAARGPAGGRKHRAVPGRRLGWSGLRPAGAVVAGSVAADPLPRSARQPEGVRRRHADRAGVRPAVGPDPGLEDVAPRSRPCLERSRVMLRHSLKLTWKRKFRTLMLSLEILVAFAIEFGIA